MRVRLLQARLPADPMADHERQCFASRLGLPHDAVLPADLLTGSLRAADVVRDVQAVVVGGSGDFGMADDAPWIPAYVDLLRALLDTGVPMFGSCFGFQGLVVALGGEVAPDPAQAEVGTFAIHRDASTDDDPVFGTLPRTFDAQLGHKDSATALPPDARLLARSLRCGAQALHVPGTRVWATQFHPELTYADNLIRLRRYEGAYRAALGDAEYEALLDGFHDTPHADGLLRTFRQVVDEG